jgi:hypothetical protein
MWSRHAIHASFSRYLARGSLSLSSSSSPSALFWHSPSGKASTTTGNASVMFLLSQSTADWMLLDMQYRHACDMYKSSRDADSSGRKLSEVGSGLAQRKDCSAPADWDTMRCPNKRCTRFNNMRTSRGHAKALCEHGFINDVFDQKRALRDCPESCPGWLRIMTRLYLPIEPLFV